MLVDAVYRSASRSGERPPEKGDDYQRREFFRSLPARSLPAIRQAGLSEVTGYNCRVHQTTISETIMLSIQDRAVHLIDRSEFPDRPLRTLIIYAGNAKIFSMLFCDRYDRKSQFYDPVSGRCPAAQFAAVTARDLPNPSARRK